MMALFDAMLALMVLLLMVVGAWHWLGLWCGLLFPPSPKPADSLPLTLHVTVTVEPVRPPPAIEHPYPPGRRIG